MILQLFNSVNNLNKVLVLSESKIDWWLIKNLIYMAIEKSNLAATHLGSGLYISCYNFLPNPLCIQRNKYVQTKHPQMMFCLFV